MTQERIALTGEKETLLVTLAAKAGESRLPDTLLRDRWAASAADRIGCDFRRLAVDRDLMVGIALRAHILDKWTREFLALHPRATVLHLGCGLDSRVFRVAPGPEVRWFDLDYPEVIGIRRRLYPDREGTELVGAAVTDPAWLARIPAEGPVLIIAEGLLPYLPASEVVPLLDRLVAHFPAGELAFDAYSRIGLWLVAAHPAIRRTGAELHWALEDPAELERAIPRLRLSEELQAYDPAGYGMAQIARMSPLARGAAFACRMVPGLGRVGRLLRYTF